jgi:hypothetical protein
MLISPAFQLVCEGTSSGIRRARPSGALNGLNSVKELGEALIALFAVMVSQNHAAGLVRSGWRGASRPR